MKKTIFIVAILMLILILGCRLEELIVEDEMTTVPDCTTFEQPYNFEAPDLAINDIAATPDGNFIICGNTDEDIFLMKINAKGGTLFSKTDVIPITEEKCNSVVVTPDGGFLVCGQRESQAFFVKYDTDGNHQNESTLPELSRCDCIINSNDGNYVYSGSIKHNNDIINTYVGSINLSNTFPQLLPGYLPTPPRAEVERAYSILAISGGYAVAGHSYNSPVLGIGTAVHFYRLDNNLELVSGSESFHHLGNQQDVAEGIVATDDGNFILTGNLENGQGADAFAFKVDENGGNLQLTQYGGLGRDFGVDIIAANEPKHYVICGHSPSFGTDTSDDIYLLKINEDGAIVWEKTFGQSGVDEYAAAVLPGEDCGYIVAGHSIQNGQSSPYIIRVDEDGNVQ